MYGNYENRIYVTSDNSAIKFDHFFGEIDRFRSKASPLGWNESKSLSKQLKQNNKLQKYNLHQEEASMVHSSYFQLLNLMY